MADAWDESGARWEVRELWFIRSEALDGFRPLPPLLQSLLLFSLLLYLWPLPSTTASMELFDEPASTSTRTSSL